VGFLTIDVEEYVMLAARTTCCMQGSWQAADSPKRCVCRVEGKTWRCYRTDRFLLKISGTHLNITTDQS